MPFNDCSNRNSHRVRSIHLSKVWLADIIGWLYRVAQADRWQSIPIPDLNRRNAPMYDSWDTDHRAPVNLTTLDLIDDDGNEIQVFDKEGMRVRRRSPIFDGPPEPCALLVNLNGIREFFEDPSNVEYDPDFEGRTPTPISVNAYRQSGFKAAGHIQVNAIPLPMVDIISNINATVASTFGEDDGSADDEDRSPFQCAVRGVDCQFYNAVMHRVRGTADTHDAQRGDVTAALSGSYAQGISQRRTATRLLEACNVRLPHQHFNHLINHTDLDTRLRVETVIHVDIKKLRYDRSSARYDSMGASPQVSSLTIFTLALSIDISSSLRPTLTGVPYCSTP